MIENKNMKAVLLWVLWMLVHSLAVPTLSIGQNIILGFVSFILTILMIFYIAEMVDFRGGSDD
jgi:hypothetical protein